MASKTKGRIKHVALGAMLSACAVSLAGCGSSANQRELEEQLAASKVQNSPKQLAVQTPQNLPASPPAQAQEKQSEADTGSDVDDSNDNGSTFGDVTDPDSGSDKFDNDLSAGMEAPNDFPAPADPPLAGEISPGDAPPPSQ